VADLGTGALANLRRYRESETLDAVVISHMHADHFIDVIPMRYELKYGPRTNDRKIPLYLPPGGEAMLRRLVDAFARETPGDFLSDVFDIRTFDAKAPLHIGAAELRFTQTAHYIPTYAMRCEVEGTSMSYSSDTAPDSAVSRLAEGVDLFFCEATLLSDEREVGERGHSSAAEAAAMASEAGARKLILTHYPAETTAFRVATEAQGLFSGEINVADDLDSFGVA
jgi:ribonuclease BN (tRNA processing enzyme)